MNKAKHLISNAFMAFVDQVLPPRCVLTGQKVEAQGMLAPEAWADLNFIARPFCARCGSPFAYEIANDPAPTFAGMGDTVVCVGCLNRPPPYRTARAALKYDDFSRRLILAFKHGDKTHMAAAFAPWLSRAGREMLAEADMLIPVPLHRWRLLARRYNQSAILCDALSKATGIPSFTLALRRIRPTPSQGYLSASERHENVRKAFAVDPPFEDRLRNRSVVLVDDVYTTGATVRECAKTLLAAGALRVDVLTLARTAKEI